MSLAKFSNYQYQKGYETCVPGTTRYVDWCNGKPYVCNDINYIAV
ncbi:hypothetical protein PV797_15460 [Clostridiaceae bacterium M8S5]|nr:hypothetical protein PV797_15460 [Clostridiaceae bacterium M8S5]